MSDLKKYRLVTRSDFDGLVCAVLLKELDMIDNILFVHPKDMQDGEVKITPNDITTNLPYVRNCYMAFDHHASEVQRLGADKPANQIIDPKAPSASRVVYEHFGFGQGDGSPEVSEEMMAAVDQGDSAQYSMEEVMHPSGWSLLNFLMDARTGLGRFRDFRIPNYQLMMELIDACRHADIAQILEMPDVAERVELYFEHEPKCKEQIQRCTTVHDNLAVIDLLDEETIYAGNRFLIYALFPDTNISIHVLWGLRKQNTVFAIGKSIFKRDSNTDISALALAYGGGGHANAGTCQIDNDVAEETLQEIIARITADG